MSDILLEGIADVLERAADMIEPEWAWTRAFYSNSAKTCFCVVGAIAHVLGTEPADAETWIIQNRIGSKLLGIGRDGWLISWNASLSQPEVVAKLREAASKAREQSAVQS